MSYLDYFRFFKRGEPEDTAKLKNLRSEIETIKKRLDELDAAKEDWFSRKQRLKKKASKFVKRLKEVRKNRDENEGKIKEFLTTRDTFNAEVHRLISEVKQISTQKKELFKKHNIKYDPLYLKEQIKKLEFSIETEAYTFKKEKEVMEQIKALRKAYDQASSVNEIVSEESKISNTIEETRKKADEAHENYKKLAEENKKLLMEFTELVKKVNEIKRMQKEALDEFIKFKNDFTQQSSLLKDKLNHIRKIREDVDKKRQGIQETQKAEEKKILDEKAKQVEEKIKLKKKLTTEDLLAYQGKKE